MATDPGIDFDCYPDLRPDLGTVSGDTALINSLARRLDEERGQLLGAPNHGYKLTDAIGRTVGSEAHIQQQVENECLKDERVKDARATVIVEDEDIEIIEINLRITKQTDQVLEFTLAIGVVTGELLLRNIR